MIIAVDFDGCLCKDKFPLIGDPNLTLIEALKKNQKEGSKVILWTCREGAYLQAAIEWCQHFGLEFDAVNKNVPENIKKYGSDSRKVFASLYIDDKSVKPYWEIPKKKRRKLL